MEKSKNKITLFNIASTVILQGLAFISGPVFSSILGPENYGIAAVYLTWVQFASTVLSLQAASTIALARVNFPAEDQNKYQSSVLSLATIIYIALSGVVLILALFGKNRYDFSIPMICIGLCHGWGMYCVTAINMKFTYEFKADKNLILSVIVSILTIGLSILLICVLPESENYWGRVVGQASVYIVIGIVIFIYLTRTGKTIYCKEYWKFTLPLSIPTVFHLLASIVLNHSDKIMIQGMISNSAAGIYALACTFGTVLQTLWNAFNNSWVPFYYEYTKQKQINEMRKHARNYLELFTVIAIGFILLSREVFHVYAKQDFWEGTDLIPFFSIGYYFVFLYSFPVNYEFYNKKTKTIAIGTTSAAVCNIVLNYLLIKLIDIQGAVIATSVAHGLQFGFHYICAKRINPGEFPFKIMDFIPGLFAVFVTCGVYWFTKDLWYIRWGIGMILGIYIMVKIFKRKEIF